MSPERPPEASDSTGGEEPPIRIVMAEDHALVDVAVTVVFDDPMRLLTESPGSSGGTRSR
jgi:hypothetical protein